MAKETRAATRGALRMKGTAAGIPEVTRAEVAAKALARGSQNRYNVGSRGDVQEVTGGQAPATAAEAYSVLIENELNHQYARKESLEQRGFAVITSSGAMVTVLVALSGVASANGIELVETARFLLVLSTVAFVVAAILGVWANRPTTYRQPNADWLAKLVQPEYWNAPASIGSRRAAESVVNRIRVAQVNNQRKSTVLKAAVSAEALGIAGVGGAVISITSGL